MLFYTHALGLPPLLYLSGGPALRRLMSWLGTSAPPPLPLPLLGVQLLLPSPRWMLLAANLASCQARAASICNRRNRSFRTSGGPP